MHTDILCDWNEHTHLETGPFICVVGLAAAAPVSYLTLLLLGEARHIDDTTHPTSALVWRVLGTREVSRTRDVKLEPAAAGKQVHAATRGCQLNAGSQSSDRSCMCRKEREARYGHRLCSMLTRMTRVVDLTSSALQRTRGQHISKPTCDTCWSPMHWC